MTVVLRQNETFELNLVEYTGAITRDQLLAVAEYGANHPQFLKTDTLNIVREDTDFSAVPLDMLDELFAEYLKLYQPLNFQIYRRAAWLCMSKASEAHIDYWVGARDLREGMSSTVRRFETLAEAGDWLLLSADELARAERGEGFTHLARFEITAPPLALAR